MQLVTRRNMKPGVLDDFDNLWLRQRSLIETINDQLKNISQLEHSYHPSLTGFMLINLVADLVACSFQNKQPSFNNQVMVDGDCCFPSMNTIDWLLRLNSG